MGKPELIVFDLDYTLWPFWIDTHVSPPFKKKGEKIVDTRGSTVTCCPGMTEMLTRLKQEGYTLAVASRTSEIKEANQLIQLLGWESLFTYKQIYPGNKTQHFSYFQQQTGLDYSQMLFFDDEHRNIRDLSAVGVKCVHVDDEQMSEAHLQKGLKLFQ